MTPSVRALQKGRGGLKNLHNGKKKKIFSRTPPRKGRDKWKLKDQKRKHHPLGLDKHGGVGRLKKGGGNLEKRGRFRE